MGTVTNGMKVSDVRKRFLSKAEQVHTKSRKNERRGRDSNPRYPKKGTPVFETGSISHSDTSPKIRIQRMEQYLTSVF